MENSLNEAEQEKLDWISMSNSAKQVMISRLTKYTWMTLGKKPLVKLACLASFLRFTWQENDHLKVLGQQLLLSWSWSFCQWEILQDLRWLDFWPFFTAASWTEFAIAFMIFKTLCITQNQFYQTNKKYSAEWF